MTTSAPPNVLADIPDELLAPTNGEKANTAQSNRLERLLARQGARPTFMDLHAEKVRRGLIPPLSNRRDAPLPRSTTR